jgi:hypothetical protein
MSSPSDRRSSRLRIGVVIALALLVVPAVAHAETATAPRETGIAHGGYIGPEGKLTSLAGSAVLLAGAQAGWIIDHAFVLGGAGYVLVSEADSPLGLQMPGAPRSTLSLAYGGARIAFVPAAQHQLHVVLGLLVGGGRVSASSARTQALADGFFVIEPDAAFEAILAPPVRIALGASYRFTGGTGIPGLDVTALDGPTAFMTLKIGQF